MPNDKLGCMRSLRADSLILSRSLRKTLKRLCHHLGIKVPHSSPSSSSDSSYLDAVLESLDGCPRFSMKVVDPAGSASSQLIFDLYSRYQMSIHGDSEDDLSPRKFRLFLCDTPLIVCRTQSRWSHPNRCCLARALGQWRSCLWKSSHLLSH